jgi:hypothetical protein
MSRPPHPPRLYNSNYTWRRVQIVRKTNGTSVFHSFHYHIQSYLNFDQQCFTDLPVLYRELIVNISQIASATFHMFINSDIFSFIYCLRSDFWECSINLIHKFFSNDYVIHKISIHINLACTYFPFWDVIKSYRSLKIILNNIFY